MMIEVYLAAVDAAAALLSFELREENANDFGGIDGAMMLV